MTNLLRCIVASLVFASVVHAQTGNELDRSMPEVSNRELAQLESELLYLQRQVVREQKLISEGRGASLIGFLMIAGTQLSNSYMSINKSPESRTLNTNYLFGIPASIGKIANSAEYDRDSFSLRIWVKKERVGELALVLNENFKTLKQLRDSQKPTFLEVAKAVGGQVQYMDQADAIQYCSAQGARLPSARELAQLSMSHGARGTVTSCETGATDCYLVMSSNHGHVDDFFFSYSGYQRPAEYPINDCYWSSSDAGASDRGRAWNLCGYAGHLDVKDRRDNLAVRCVLGR